MTGKKVIPAKMLFFNKWRKKYCVVGTVIPEAVNSKTIVWGSGYGLADLQMKCKPAKVLAVRGPLTRQYLLNQGIDCPKVYGDPALLLPKYYAPKSLAKKKLGFILHHRDWDIIDDSMIAKLQSEGLLIDLTRYDCWTDVIDEICSCEIILSSSLHGLIVSDAYGIPNLFMEFFWRHGNYTKYQDYFFSVGRTWNGPILYSNNMDLENLRKQAETDLFQVNINTEGLEKSCPFT